MSRPLGYGTVLLLLALSGCSGSPESDLQRFVDQSEKLDTFSFSQVYEGAEKVVVVCAFDSAKAVQDELGFRWPQASDLSVGESQQAVVAVAGDEVVGHEVLGREVLDLCADPATSTPLVVDAETVHSVVSEEWSDGTRYPVVRFG